MSWKHKQRLDVSMKTASLFGFDIQVQCRISLSSQVYIGMSSEKLNKPIHSMSNTSRKLILNEKEWSRIKSSINPRPIVDKTQLQDQMYEEYLRDESRKMTAKWEDTIEKIRQRKLIEQKKKSDEEKAKADKCLQEVKKLDEETRRQRIEYAERMLQRLKAGPRQLESAYKLSNILGLQEQQRQTRSEQKKLEFHEQAAEWIESQKEQMRKYQRRCGEYNSFLRNEIEQKAQQRKKDNRCLLELEKNEMERNLKQMEKVLKKENENETERKLDRQKADFLSIYNKKQTQCKYVKKLNEEQKRINDYLETKFHDEAEQKYRRMLKQKQQIAHRNELAKKVFDSLPDIEGRENVCYQKAVKEHAEKWNEQQQKRMNHDERLREDRIKYHQKEQEELQKFERERVQDHEREKLTKKFNEQIDVHFSQQQRSEKMNRLKNLRKFISSQIDADKRAKREEIVQNRIDTNRAIESANDVDDRTFFNYATKLLNHAKGKGYPLKPLKRTIDEYKVLNCLLPQKDDLPHLKSHIDIGISLERKYSK